VTPLVRPPTDAERSTVLRRLERSRAALAQHLPRVGDAGVVGIFGAGLALGSLTLLSGFVSWFGGAFGVVLAGIAFLGVRGNLRLREERFLALIRQRDERLANVREYGLDLVAAQVVSDPDGDGQDWWVLFRREGDLFVLSSDFFDPGDAPPDTWRAHTTIVFDGWETVVRIDGDGDEVPVQRTGIRLDGDGPTSTAVVTDDTLFWSPPEDAEVPGVLSADAFRPRRLSEPDPDEIDDHEG
jgi:hypothetical protein